MTKLSEFADSEEPVHMHKMINSFTMDVITKVLVVFYVGYILRMF